MTLDLLARTVRRGTVQLDLPQRQFELLAYLMKHPGETVSRQMIAEHVWRESSATWTNVIEVQVNQLRKKLQAEAFDQQIRLRKCVLGDGREMLVSGWVRSSSFGPLLVTAATSTEPFNRELVTLESTVAMILPVSLACSLICGYWLAGRVLRPVRELVRAARALSIDSLDQRIHVEIRTMKLEDWQKR
jgi:HAMP domain-containing protein